ncbi:hypothetical protein [Streptomyces sp. NPDC001970]
MEIKDIPNSERARRGAAALDEYTRTAKEQPPVSAEGIASMAKAAADHGARVTGDTVTLAEQAEADLTEAAQRLTDVVADVLHHMDGADFADVLISGAWHVYGLQTGEERGAVMVQTADAQTGDVIEFLAALCHAAVTVAEDPLDMLARGLRHFEEEAEAERIAHVRENRRQRLTA